MSNCSAALQETQRSSVFAHHLCLLDRWVNTKSAVVFSAKDASSRILCFFMHPMSFSHSPSLTWLLSVAAKVTCLSIQTVNTWLNRVFFFFFLKGETTTHRSSAGTVIKKPTAWLAKLAPAVCAFANYSFIIWAINGTFRKWQLQMETRFWISWSLKFSWWFMICHIDV